MLSYIFEVTQFGVTQFVGHDSSHDCNPIETVFARWKEKIYERLGTTSRSMDKLHKVMIEEWGNLDQEEIRNIIDLQPKVMNAIIENDGKNTKY